MYICNVVYIYVKTTHYDDISLENIWSFYNTSNIFQVIVTT